MNIINIKNFGDIIAFSNLDNSFFDLYCYPDRPRMIHDKYGARAVDDFFNVIIGELEIYNSNIFRVSYSVFAIPYSSNNPEFLSINFKSVQYILTRRTVKIDNVLTY